MTFVEEIKSSTVYTEADVADLFYNLNYNLRDKGCWLMEAGKGNMSNENLVNRRKIL